MNTAIFLKLQFHIKSIVHVQRDIEKDPLSVKYNIASEFKTKRKKTKRRKKEIDRTILSHLFFLISCSHRSDYHFTWEAILGNEIFIRLLFAYTDIFICFIIIFLRCPYDNSMNFAVIPSKWYLRIIVEICARGVGQVRSFRHGGSFYAEGKDWTPHHTHREDRTPSRQCRNLYCPLGWWANGCRRLRVEKRVTHMMLIIPTDDTSKVSRWHPSRRTTQVDRSREKSTCRTRPFVLRDVTLVKVILSAVDAHIAS